MLGWMDVTAARFRGVPRRVDVGALPSLIGSDDFYDELARLDPGNAKRWMQMDKTQRTFKRAEAGYANPVARTYSESCRETLHRIAIALLHEGGSDIYADFIRLHPTLFKENGACDLSTRDQLAILLHTEPKMLFGHGNPLHLAQGVVDDAPWVPLVHEASEQTRAARKARGLPITVSGYQRDK